MKTVLVNGTVKAKRGVFKAYREYLNSLDASEGSNGKYHNGRYKQVCRPYGDYLFYQDRVKFEHDLAEALQGRDEGFDHQRWVA